MEKNSMRKGELGVLWSAAFTVVVLPTDAADEITGKFWKLFGPLWPLESLGVTLSFPRSIPSWALEKIELLRMELPVPADMSSPTPAAPFPNGALPAALVPMELP